jgi:DNA processing protein
MAPATDEQAAVLALVKATPHDWYRTADIIACTGSALRLIHGDYGPFDDDQRRHAELVLSRLQPDDLTAAATLIDRTRAQGAHLVTVLDEDYPDNLHMIYNRPPFIWVRGRLGQDDIRSVAIVGTRQPTGQGRAEAARFAQDLAEAGITVVSGLARGIDTAAHTAALRAGGRTIAVVGNGILSRTYPAENAHAEHCDERNRCRHTRR